MRALAARKTFRTQPTVSAQVAELEERLGVKLFDRLGKRKVLITREGEILRAVATPKVTPLSILARNREEIVRLVRSAFPI